MIIKTQQFYRFLSNMMCIFCASFMLIGCSYFDVAEPELEKPVVVEEEPAPREPISVQDAIRQNTDGAVEVFGFDDEGVGAEQSDFTPITQDAVQSTYDAEREEVTTFESLDTSTMNASPVRSAPSDPSVQIFPFDDMPMPTSSYAAAPPPMVQPMKDEDFVAVSNSSGQPVIVYFDHNSSRLNSDAKSKISSLASSFNAAGGNALNIEGHASVRANYSDPVQRRLVNLKISMNRAFAVAKALISDGVPAEFLRVMAWGDTRPPLDLGEKSAEEAARRVEISR